ncbi:MAG: hypothetical protein KAS13_02140 [Candidatus Omnitrophica bacterium]|nr:hypothetical protein [Candidatus Omnitrophota bacterium]
MNVLLFIIALGVSFVAVRLGAIAFELTGIAWSMASFQSLSCFSGTGFTTKESELIMSNPQRRRIASTLIILGHAGFVTLIATLANSLRPELFASDYTISLFNSAFPASIQPWVKLGVVIIAIIVSYRIATYTQLDEKVTNFLRSRFFKNELIKRVTFEELVVATGGYGISQIEIFQDSPVLDKTLMNSELRDAGVSVLAIQKEGEITPNPPARTKIDLGDKLICFGKLEDIRKKICVLAK